jgi:transposase
LVPGSKRATSSWPKYPKDSRLYTKVLQKARQISHQWIYELIHRDQATDDLRTYYRLLVSRRNRRQMAKAAGLAKVPNRVGIAARDVIVSPLIIGYWEGDTVLKLILPVTDGHTVKRVNYATEVSNDITIETSSQATQTAFRRIQIRGPGACSKDWHQLSGETAWMHDSQLYGWRTKAKAKDQQNDAEQLLATENTRLKRQLAEHAEELAILKKAVAYFARNVK